MNNYDWYSDYINIFHIKYLFVPYETLLLFIVSVRLISSYLLEAVAGCSNIKSNILQFMEFTLK